MSPHLKRLRAAAAERQLAAQLIADQDAAFAASAERDRERIEMATIAKMEKEAEEERRKREEEERKRIEQEEKEREKREKEERIAWWRYARRCLLAPEPGTDTGTTPERPVRIVIRLPSGTRQVRSFLPSASISHLYLAAAASLIPQQYSTSDDPTEPPSTSSPFSRVRTVEDIEQRCWNFEIYTAYPRHAISWNRKLLVGDVEGLQGGGQVVVELHDEGVVRPANGEGGNGSDGYDTEED